MVFATLALAWIDADIPEARAQEKPRLELQWSYADGDSIDLSHDGKLALIASKKLALWNMETKSQLSLWPQLKSEYKFAHFVPSKAGDGLRVVTADSEGQLSLWDGNTGALVRRFKGIEGRVEALEIDSEGRTGWAYGWSDKPYASVLCQFDIESGAELRRESSVSQFAISPDNRWLATAGFDGKVSIRAASTFEVRVTFDPELPGYRFAPKLAFSPDSQKLVMSVPYSQSSVAKVWSVPEAKPLFEVPGYGEMAFTRDGRRFLINDHARNVTAYQLDADGVPQVAEVWKQSEFKSAYPLADGRMWLTGPSVPRGDLTSYTDNVFLDLASKKFEAGLRSRQPFRVEPKVSLSPDQRLILLGSSLWNNEQGLLVQKNIDTTGRDDGFNLFSFMNYLPRSTPIWLPSSTGRKARLAVMTPGSNDKNALQLWDVSENSVERRPVAEVPNIYRRIAISPDGRWVALGNDVSTKYKPLMLWDGAGTQKLQELGEEGELPTALAFSPDAKTLAVVGRDIELLNVASGTVYRRLTPPWLKTQELDEAEQPKQDTPISISGAVAFSPDGQSIVAINYPPPYFTGQLCLWDVKSGSLIWKRSMDDPRINVASLNELNLSLAFAPHGKTIVCSDQGGAIKKISVLDGKDSGRFPGRGGVVQSLAFTANGSGLWSASGDGSYVLWDTTTLRQKAELWFLDEGKWLLLDDSGHFDTNCPQELDVLKWVYPSRPFNPLPVETFFDLAYQPGLLPRLSKGEKLVPIAPARFAPEKLPSPRNH